MRKVGSGLDGANLLVVDISYTPNMGTAIKHSLHSFEREIAFPEM